MNKNILIKLGALVTATAPIVGVVSCGKKAEAPETDKMKQANIVKYFTDAKKKISIPASVTITNNETLLVAIKAAIGTGLTKMQKDAITIKTAYGVLTKGTEKNINIIIKVGKEAMNESIILMVTQLKTDVMMQDDIKAYFTADTDAKKTISIPSTTTITDNPTLLTAIKAAIGTGLTKMQKDAITIKTAYGVLAKGTKKDITIAIQVGKANKDESITLMVTHQTDATTQAAIVTHFTADAAKKTIYIPNATTITDNSTLLTAIKTAIGTDLTKAQKDAITIKTSYVGLTKGTKKDITIAIQVGAAVKNESIALMVTHLQTDVIRQTAIETYFTANANAKKTISIPTATTITDNPTLLTAIKEVIGSDLTKMQKDAITIKLAYVALVKGTTKTIQIAIKVGSETEKLINLMVTHAATISIDKTYEELLAILNNGAISYWDGNSIRVNPALTDSARFVKEDKSTNDYIRYYFHVGLNVPQTTLTNTTIASLNIKDITTTLQLDAKIQENHKEVIIKNAGAHTNDRTWTKGKRYSYYFKLNRTNPNKEVYLHYTYKLNADGGTLVNRLLVNLKTV